MNKYWGRTAPFIAIVALMLFATACSSSPSASAQALPTSTSGTTSSPAWNSGGTTTPIKHIVVIFQENISFAHSCGTYPVPTNPAGEPAFHASHDAPRVNGLTTALLAHNPNS